MNYLSHVNLLDTATRLGPNEWYIVYIAPAGTQVSRNVIQQAKSWIERNLSNKEAARRIAEALGQLPGGFLAGIGVPAVQTANGQQLTDEVRVALELEKQASYLFSKGHTEKAEVKYKQALTALERSLPDDPILAGSLNNVAQFYRALKRYAEAAELLNRALAICVAAYGDDHTVTTAVMSNLAGTYMSDRKFDAAEVLYKRNLAATEKLWPDDLVVAFRLAELAHSIFPQGRHAEAEAYMKRGIDIAEKFGHPDSRLVASLLQMLVPMLKAQGREEEATALQQRAQKLLRSRSSR